MVSWVALDNIIGIDSQLVDPENGDYRVSPGSPAEGYGCQIFADNEITNSFFEPDTEIKIDMSRKRSSIEVSGTIDENTIWQVDTVRVVGDVTIENDVILTIQAGTEIEFQDFYTKYNNIEFGHEGEGNIDEDPYF